MARRCLVLALVLLCAACSVGSDINWVQEGASVGRGLADEGRARSPANCERAVFEYARDVGLPTGDDVADMQRGCERG